jgi:hypothetical protein
MNKARTMNSGKQNQDKGFNPHEDSHVTASGGEVARYIGRHGTKRIARAA